MKSEFWLEFQEELCTVYSVQCTVYSVQLRIFYLINSFCLCTFATQGELKNCKNKYKF